MACNMSSTDTIYYVTVKLRRSAEKTTDRKCLMK